MMPHTKELPLPTLCDFNDEIIRVWMVGDEEEDRGALCIIDTTAFDNGEAPNGGAGVWGIVLADIAQHIASGLKDSRGLSEQAVLDDIRKLFNAELQRPTDTLTTTRLGDPERSPGDLDS
jgi:hypothetical protein